MARRWQPKYNVHCTCGWKGKRTKRMMSKLCPRCQRKGDTERKVKEVVLDGEK